jgi:transcriptional regulator with XRE-family HTH domain
MFSRTSKRQQARLRYRQWRVLADLSQADVAVQAKMTKERYWQIENGYREPTEQELLRLAKIFRATPEQMAEQVAHL